MGVIEDAFAALARGDYLCLLGLMAGIAMLILLLVILRIKKAHKESQWAYNPDKKLRLRWRRG